MPLCPEVRDKVKEWNTTIPPLKALDLRPQLIRQEDEKIEQHISDGGRRRRIVRNAETPHKFQQVLIARQRKRRKRHHHQQYKT